MDEVTLADLQATDQRATCGRNDAIEIVAFYHTLAGADLPLPLVDELTRMRCQAAWGTNVWDALDEDEEDDE